MIYLPPDTTRAKVDQKLFVGVMAYSGVGKTSLALTAPNHYFLDFDGKTPPGTIGRNMNDPDWVKSTRVKNIPGTMNTRDAFLIWLAQHAPKFSAEQVLVVDTFTSLAAAYTATAPFDPDFRDKAGDYDKWTFYRKWKEYVTTIFSILKQSPAHVLMLFHETVERNNKGEVMANQAKPLIEGAGKDEIPRYFNFFMRLVRLNVTSKEPSLILAPSDGSFMPTIPIGVNWKPGDILKPTWAAIVAKAVEAKPISTEATVMSVADQPK